MRKGIMGELCMTVNIERLTRQMILLSVIAFLCVVALVFILVMAYEQPVDDTMLSPDMVSYIETSKSPVVIAEWDIE
jgi:hypothetical protein